ncbi:ADP-ribosylglycohydrolase family protein [Actinoplanes sp. L3-i22]|uniref:ADP-ribosylglycohydrolase family protein n=1 Tax=Actinoplanes sp. L3-i22 TaxID=2836373 RepID=UPI001C76AC01|nr:ADP-ribosylglycohydrolase family protein [Actinoplanes sp. L3-i22]BCY07509.1 hydrolase [Actinoplanes sp. L3-i22]
MGNTAAAVAAMRGVWLGDAFGETWCRRPAGDFAERRLADGPWTWTDDTAMALPLLRVLVAHGRVDQDVLAAEFATEYAADPYRNYGAGMHDVLAAFGAGEGWAVVTRRQFDGSGSWGNGAAMRVPPLGAWFAGDLDAVVAEAGRSAVVTHAHPEAAAGAVAVAVAAALSVRGGDWSLGDVVARVPAGQVADGLRRAADFPGDADPREVGAVVGSGLRISAPDTVPYALWCAARHQDDLAAALWATASAGGDIDTTCAIAGGVVGARTGLAGVPGEWLKRCEGLPAWVDRLA